MDIGNVYPTKNEIQRQYDQKQADMDKNLQKQMVFNENLQKVLKETQGIKPFNYDSVFKEKNELEKQHILLHVKFKALTMEKKDVDSWWDVMHDIVQKDIWKGL